MYDYKNRFCLLPVESLLALSSLHFYLTDSIRLLLSLLLRVGTFNLWLDQSLEVVTCVPPSAKAFRLTELNDYLICSRSAQSVNIDPADSTEKFANFSVGLIVALLVTFAS